MSETVYKDYLPANARILVNYKSNERVRFTYPIEWSYWKAVRKRAFPTVIAFIGVVLFTIVTYAMMIAIPIMILYLYNKVGLTITYQIQSQIITRNLGIELLQAIGNIGILFCIFFGIPGLITLYLALDEKRLSKWIPKMGYWTSKILGREKTKTFTKKDVNGNTVVIPIFDNVYLDYHATGDFEKYLETIDIYELPFTYKIKPAFFPFLRKAKKEKNDFNFRAAFRFSKKPVVGELKTVFI
jgi:hypothetical protein